MPKVSFITASYNYQDYIKETIESILKQTVSDWEMIIVDDGSKDNSVNVIKSYCDSDSRIKLYQHENGMNKGLAETIKLGLTKASADWIVFLESDDTIEPNYLQEKLSVLEKYSNVDYIFNDINFFGEERVIKSYENNITRIRNYLKNKEFPCNLKEIFVKSDMNIISTFSIVMMKKSLLKNVDFNSPIKKFLDYYLWLQLLENTNFYYIDKKLTNWRMHGQSYVNKKENYLNVVKFEQAKRLIIYKNKNKILNVYIPMIPYYLKYLRKSLFMLHLSDGEIILLGKPFYFKNN